MNSSPSSQPALPHHPSGLVFLDPQSLLMYKFSNHIQFSSVSLEWSSSWIPHLLAPPLWLPITHHHHLPLAPPSITPWTFHSKLNTVLFRNSCLNSSDPQTSNSWPKQDPHPTATLSPLTFLKPDSGLPQTALLYNLSDSTKRTWISWCPVQRFR